MLIQNTVQQGLTVLVGEHLSKTAVMMAPSTFCARSYAGHHQIVNAICRDEGGDNFVRERKGLHCGIRKHFVPVYATEDAENPCGVEVVESLDEGNAEDIAEHKALKYPTPDVSTLEFGDFLSDTELDFFFDTLPEESDEWVQAAAAVAMANNTLAAGNNIEEEQDDDDDDDLSDTGLI